MKSSPGQLPQIKSKPFRTCERDTSKNSMNEEQQLEHISSSKYVSQQRCKTRDIIHCFQKKGIKMIALDFDKTILSIHTYGRYQGTAETLVEHVRSTFHYLIEGILNSPGFGKNLFLCIVTFSPQESLIRKLLAVLFQTRKIDRIIIRCNTKSFLSSIRNEDFLGKEYHLSSVMTQINREFNQVIKSDEIILFDDDVRNTSIAEHFSHYAFHVDDRINLDVIKQYALNL